MTTQTVTPEADQILTQEELAERWKVTVRWLQILRKKKEGPKYIAIGRIPRYPMSEVLAYEKAMTTNGTTRKNRNPKATPEKLAEMVAIREKNRSAKKAQ